ncbi:hypothetical protein H8356DRAFT_1308873 [Neocallimastix lanati (nom. inval.)]|nr:hypothetical protein H8356DRAFT_1308873 [Neocallimastix sp. JGI-2020a]
MVPKLLSINFKIYFCVYLCRNNEIVTTLSYRQNCHYWKALLSIQHWRSEMHIIDKNFLVHFFSEIKSIPPEIGNLILLKELNLDYNRIGDFPLEILSLKHLYGNAHCASYSCSYYCSCSCSKHRETFHRLSIPEEIKNLSLLK